MNQTATVLLMLCATLPMSLPASAAAQAPSPQLVVRSAIPDPSGQTLTIAGANFGSRPLVTLDLIPVTVQFGIDSQLVAAVPIGQMPPGTYLLTVSRGPGATESGSFPLTLARPAATPRPAGSNPPTGAALSLPEGDAAAKVGDRAISVAELDREWARTDPASYLAASRRLYEGRRRVADQMVTDRLLAGEAAARGLSVEALR